MSSTVMLQQCSLANTPHLSFYRVHVEVKFISAATVNLLKRTWVQAPAPFNQQPVFWLLDEYLVVRIITYV